MEWIVKIENVLNQRILVNFNAETNELIFIGQYKPHSKDWINFSKIAKPLWNNLISPNSESIDGEIIKTSLFDAYEEMNKKIKLYEEINEGFSLIKVIEIKE